MINKLVPWKKSGLQREDGWNDHPLDRLHREVNVLFDSFFQRPGYFVDRVGASSGLEVSETDDEIRVKAELPGLDEKDIGVSIQENVLTIRGEHREEMREKKRKYHLSEMHYGSCSRTIPLPAEVDAGRAAARFKRGVLTLTLPKTEQAKAARRRIPVTAG